MNVLILKLTAMGDILQTLPAIRHLVRLHPEVEIDWLVKPQFAEVLEFFPNIRKVFYFDRDKLRHLRGALGEWRKLKRALSETHYDQVIDLQGQFRLALLGKSLRPTVLRGSSLNSDALARLCYSETVAFEDTLTHRCDQYLAVVNGLNPAELTQVECVPPPMTRFAPGVEALLARHRLKGGCDVLIGIVVGANWASRTIAPEFFVSFIRLLRLPAPQVKFLLLGAEKEREAAEKILHAAGEGDLVNCCGATSMGESIELIRQCDLVLTSDTGPLHAAVALGRPTVSLFGAFPARLTAPRSPRDRVLDAKLECGGCRLKVCRSGDNRCLNAINPEQAVEAALELLAGRLAKSC